MKATDIDACAVKAVRPRRFKVLSLVCVIACLMAMSGAVRAARLGRELSLGIPGNMPLADLQDGRVVGIIAETTVMALERMGWRAQPRLLPFKRMYQWAHTGRLDADCHLDNFRKLVKQHVDMTALPESAARYFLQRKHLSQILYIAAKPHSEFERSFFVMNWRQDILAYIDQVLVAAAARAEWEALLRNYQ